MKKYEYKGKMQTVSELCVIYFKEKGVDISNETMRYRLSARDSVHEVFNFESESKHVDEYLCPDGIVRSHKEIARYLCLSEQAWYQRFYNHGIKKAWEIKGRGKYKKNMSIVDYQLSLIPSPTHYEELLYS